jgi:hypothetical protein
MEGVNLGEDDERMYTRDGSGKFFFLDDVKKHV